MTLKEFLNTIYFTQYHIIIPLLGRAKIEKKQFMVKGKYDINKQYEYLTEVFELNKHKLK